jgi:hypothetical protein
LLDADDHPAAVDVSDFEAGDFGRPQSAACAVVSAAGR